MNTDWSKLLSILLLKHLSKNRLTRDDIGTIHVTWIREGKYTICEIVRGKKHYHGLAAKHPDDKENIKVGYIISFDRAFKEMIGDIHTEVQRHEEDSTWWEFIFQKNNPNRRHARS